VTPTDYTLPPDLYAKAVAFAHAQYLAYFGVTATTLLVLFLVVRFRLAVRLREFAERRSRRLAWQVLLFAPPLILLLGLAAEPWLIFAHRISLAFGISVEGWGAWAWDEVKSQAITVILGTLGVWLFVAIVRWSPRRYWVWFWLASLPLMVAGVYLAPLVIDPLFFRVEPLARTHPELVPPIEKVLKNARVEIPATRLFELMASEKTNALSAYTTGFGSSKRVVLYDTIIRKEPLPELMTTFGHELGHFVLQHIMKWLLFGAVLMFVGMCAGYRVVEAVVRGRGPRLGIRTAGDLAALPLFLLFAAAASFLSDPVTNTFSRAIEHQADAYSLEVTQGVIPEPGYAAARAFQIEGESALALPNPNPAIVWWMYTHPPTRDRLRFCIEWQKAHGN